MSHAAPTAEHATQAAEIHLGWRPVEVRRFPTGSAHYVFDLRDPDGRTAVARFGVPAQDTEIAEGAALMRRLRALGVPLPELFAVDRIDGLPFALMQRIPGTDLINVVGSLTEAELHGIAKAVVDAQRAASRFGSAGRYGFAASAEAAPFESWIEVLRHHFDRSRARLLAAGLFAPSVLAPVEAWLERMAPQLAGIAATPFLHDTSERNVMIDGGRFSGIVDVDDLCFGDARYTPALTLAVLMAQGRPEGYVHDWMAIAGHADDELFRLYVALFLLDLMAEHGQVFNGNETASTPEARARLLDAMARVLA